MMRGLLLCALLAAPLVLPPHAYAAADLAGTTNAASASDVADCYRLAGEQYAPPAFAGVAIESIDAEAAIQACEAARAAAPDDAMLSDLTGRAYQARGDYQNAKRFFQAAATAGNAYGKANLAWFLIEGPLGETDRKGGLDIMRAAAEDGNILAQYSMGLIYREGRAGQKPNAAAAVKWLTLAAGQGHAVAMYDLAIIMRDGDGVPADQASAFGWLQKAASLADVDSMAALGYAYEQGLGTAVDFNQARIWYEKAADAHQVDAMTNLGRLYEAGEGVAVDHQRAFLLYSDAAEGGNATAMANLANCYEFGMGTEPNPKQAAYWLARSIMAGNVDVLEQLAGAPDEYSSDVRTALQAFLQERGLYPGPLDGKVSDTMLSALRSLPEAAQ